MAKKRKRHKKDRSVRKGIDYNKVAKIWKTLAEAEDYLSIRETARRSGLDESTTRRYISNYLERFVDVQEIIPGLRLKLIKLKAGISFESIVKWLRIKEKLNLP